MKKLKPVLAVIMIGGLLAILWGQYSANEKLRRDNAVLRSTVAEWTRLQEIPVAAAGNSSLTQEQLKELAGLRSGVTRLREQTNRIGALGEENQKLIASLKKAKNSESDSPKKKGPEDALPQDIHPRNSWAFRGYASPEATIESLFWAEMNGDKAAMLGAVSPELQPKVESEFEGDELAEKGSKNAAIGFRITDRRWLSEQEVVLTFYTDRQSADGHIFYNDFSPTVFQRIGGEWKITDKHAPDN